MIRRLGPRWSAGVGGVLAAALLVQAGTAQSRRMPSTLRYGSGLLDIPVATVLPHLSLRATYSGFGVSVPEMLLVDDDGTVPGGGEAYDGWLSDGSITIGLFDRLEIGATVQHLDEDEGGRMLGTFGRLSLLPAALRYVDVAVGARHVSAPSYDDRPQRDHQPGRFGHPDPRVFNGRGGADEFRSTLSPYVAATALLPGPGVGPDYDVSVTAGWGGGMFSAGGDLDFYAANSSGGLFVGSAVHVRLARGRLLDLVAEYNGFDANAGLQLDLGGIRVGAFVLGLWGDDRSIFRARKLGVLASVLFCAGVPGSCSAPPGGVPPDTVVLPAPPPDTVVIERTVASPPVGRSATLCLATGVDVPVVLTAAGDTLVGPAWTPVADLRPGVDFAGVYAGAESWFDEGEPLVLNGRSYTGSGDPVRLDCATIVRVGDHRGVPVFADLGAEQPYDAVYVPMAPGSWQVYRPLPSQGPASAARSSGVSMSDRTSR